MNATISSPISRRTALRATLQVAGAALVVGFDVPQVKAADEKPAVNPLNSWIKIDANGKITIRYSKSEMGQGISTSLPMILAEELGADWKDVNVEHAPVERVYGPQGTGGSGSITTLYTPLRQAGAAARTMLVSAAAQHWKVSPGDCQVRASAVWHNSDKLSFAELVEPASKLAVPDLATVKLKDPADFTLIGKSVARTDIPAKTDGSAIFGLDVRVPNMVFAVIARCPVFGGRVKSFDASEAKAMKGVMDVFEVEPAKEVHAIGGVAVVAETTYIAMQARKKLKIQWDEGPAAIESSETLRKEFRRVVDSPMKLIINDGNAEAAMQEAPAEKRVACDYEAPFQAHATMEPMNCTVDIGSGKAEVWAPHQAPDMVQMIVAKVSGVPPDKVKVHATYMGGGFGRRYQGDFPTEATQIGLHIKRPVQLVWSREDDMTHDFYRPASYHRMNGAVDGQGNITAWHHKYTSTPISEWFSPNAAPESSELGLCSQLPYQTKSYKLEYTPAKSHVPRAWWRSVEASVVGFVLESYVDELAHAAGMDPYEFRMRTLGDDRLVKDALDKRDIPLDIARFKGVLQLCAEKGDWGKPMPAGQGRGIAVHYAFHSYVANLAEVTVRNGVVKVDRIVSAVDIGVPVNPDGIRAQVESAIVYGLTAALKSEITVESGKAVQTNFNKFTTLSMKETPIIEVHIVPSSKAPTGIGEPGLPPTAPAVANAIFAATGKRMRRLPIRPADLA